VAMSRTQIENQIGGLLAEYGVVQTQHFSQLRNALPQLEPRSFSTASVSNDRSPCRDAEVSLLRFGPYVIR